MEKQQQDDAPASVVIAKQPGGKPDAAAHGMEMDKIKAELDKVHAKMVRVPR